MECFLIIKNVLDKLYSQISVIDLEEKDDQIETCLKDLSNKYKQLLTNTPKINYRDPVTRFAYIFKYVTSHANIVYQIISDCKEISDLFTMGKIKVACIGGGPGTELVGILKYLITQKINTDLYCDILDKENAWNDT